jgi:hypothetical protein
MKETLEMSRRMAEAPPPPEAAVAVSTKPES